MRTRPFLRWTLVLAGSIVVASQAQTATFTCKGPKGETILQQMPCAVINDPPPPPKPKPPCDLDADQLRRASRAEERFLSRSPDEVSHRRAKLAELQPVIQRIRSAKVRFDELATQRKSIDKELAFYEKKPIPAWLTAQLDANEAQFAALADILRGHKEEINVIQARYQCDQDTFGKMWAASAAPGSSACSRPACAPPP